jgi:hypothetical protein
MRPLIMSLVLAAATLGAFAATPSKAQAQWGRWRSYYYTPGTYSYYPSTYAYVPATTVYSAPTYSYYYTPAYATPTYGYSYAPAYATPRYSYYYTPGYYYGPAWGWRGRWWR